MKNYEALLKKKMNTLYLIHNKMYYKKLLKYITIWFYINKHCENFILTLFKLS